MFGSASGRAGGRAGVVVTVEFMAAPYRRNATAARPRPRMPAPPQLPVLLPLPFSKRLCRPLVEKLVYPPRRFRADAVDLHQVGNRGALDRLERTEVQQQRPFARRADAGDLLQTGLAQILGTPGPMRANGETMGLIAQPLNEVKHRIARRQLERVAAR